MSNNEENELEVRQRLQYAVGRVCDTYMEHEESTMIHRQRPKPSKETLTILSDLLYKEIELTAMELQHFAHHANRKVIKPEDVLLLARKQPHVHRALVKFQREQLPPVPKKRRRQEED